MLRKVVQCSKIRHSWAFLDSPKCTLRMQSSSKWRRYWLSHSHSSIETVMVLKSGAEQIGMKLLVVVVVGWK